MAHSRFLFRPRRLVRTRSAVSNAVWVCGAVAVLLALLAWGHAADSEAASQRPAAAPSTHLVGGTR